MTGPTGIRFPRQWECLPWLTVYLLSSGVGSPGPSGQQTPGGGDQSGGEPPPHSPSVHPASRCGSLSRA